MYDLPVATPEQRKAYTDFRKALKSQGFIPMQESVYVLLVHNHASTRNEMAKVRAVCPLEGDVNLLPLPMSTFELLTNIRGTPFDMSLFADDIIWR